MEKCDLTRLPFGTFIGIDPGEKGAYAVLSKDKQEFIVKCFETKGVEGYKNLSKQTYVKNAKIFCERERVSMMMSPGAATTFMTGYGFCLGVCHCLGVEPTLYDPQVWMKILGLNNLLANPDGSKPTAAQKKRHHTVQIRALWGDYVKDVPDYAIDAYGILLAGLIELSKNK